MFCLYEMIVQFEPENYVHTDGFAEERVLFVYSTYSII